METWGSVWSRRWARRGITVTATVLLVVGVAYTGFWLFAAHKIKQGVAEFADTAQAQDIAVSWQKIHVGGYPFRFRLELTGLHVAKGAASSDIDATVARFFASARPWDFSDWNFAVPDALSATSGTGAAAMPKLAAGHATGAISLRPDGGTTIWLTLWKVGFDSGFAPVNHLAVDQAITWLILPARPPSKASDQYFGLGLDLRGIVVPVSSPPFGKTIDDISLGLAVLGPVPSAPLAAAVDGWRQGGGSVALDRYEVAWDKVDIAGKGNVALDADLQPSGSISARIEGYDQLLTALSVAGLMQASDVTPAKIALAMLGPAISTYVTIKDGDLFLGPANLGKAPRIEWK